MGCRLSCIGLGNNRERHVLVLRLTPAHGVSRRTARGAGRRGAALKAGSPCRSILRDFALIRQGCTGPCLLATPLGSVESSPRLRITPQANLPRSFSAKWRSVRRIWKARLPFSDSHFRPASREDMRCITLRAEPITVVGQSSTAPARRGAFNRRKQVESALAKLVELAVACSV
jgi:hypothetical protein